MGEMAAELDLEGQMGCGPVPVKGVETTAQRWAHVGPCLTGALRVAGEAEMCSVAPRTHTQAAARRSPAGRFLEVLGSNSQAPFAGRFHRGTKQVGLAVL